MLEQMRSEEAARLDSGRAGLNAAGGSSSAAGGAPGQNDEGYWAYMQRQVQERTERLNVMGDSMDNLQESSSKWSEDVSKYVSSQKKKAVMGSEFDAFLYTLLCGAALWR